MKNVIGFIIILFGVGFLLQQLNVPGAEHIMSWWWSLAIIAIGILAWNSNRRMWYGPLMIILVGVILLVDQLHIFNQSAWNYFWPVIVILFGARILFGRSWEGRMKADTGPADASVLFSGIERKVTGPMTDSAISAWFGGVKLDLREAQIAEHATLAITAGFGGVELYVPKNVRIVSKVAPIFGGTEDKSHPDANATKTLTITGSAIFGGVSIKN